jgi:heme/copper-type cytochrome/quinol oxidase subunit 2
MKDATVRNGFLSTVLGGCLLISCMQPALVFDVQTTTRDRKKRLLLLLFVVVVVVVVIVAVVAVVGSCRSSRAVGELTSGMNSLTIIE